MFNATDSEQFQNKGIQLSTIRRQIDHFIEGFPFIRLNRPAIPGDGMIVFNDQEQAFYISHFDHAAPKISVIKFVPASGAASRMFKHIFEFRDKYSSGVEGDTQLNRETDFNSVHYLLSHLNQMAFYPDLSDQITRSGTSVEQILENKDYATLFDFLLTDRGLDYANLPKALLKFHLYADGARTAAEEHMVEAGRYTTDQFHKARIHFTISPEHKEKFLRMISAVRSKYEDWLKVHFEITFSIQKPSTDTIAVDENNRPFRNPDGSLLFRPGGHGALLENLNELDADLIFIKNIDNIVPDRLKDTTIQYKKLLGGYLLYLKETIAGYLFRIRQKQVTFTELENMASFARKKLFLDIPGHFNTMKAEDQVNFLFAQMNRPIRVCGMVKNEGEPGGGPFWVMGDDDRQSLQIVEASQINMHNPEQKAIVGASTHFNPVDLVCTTKDFEGNLFDLTEFVDESTGFISLKSSGGKTLKAQELPGLWNGAMAKWITIFVEVPIITFNPVKTINDLLRKEHLPVQP